MNVSPVAAKVLAWAIVPVFFSVLAKSAYLLVGTALAGGFFPTAGFWLICIGVGLGAGITALCKAIPKPGLGSVIFYAVAMAMILIVLQVTISCTSGDCI